MPLEAAIGGIGCAIRVAEIVVEREPAGCNDH
jgi:hypothetical protein